MENDSNNSKKRSYSELENPKGTTFKYLKRELEKIIGNLPLELSSNPYQPVQKFIGKMPQNTEHLLEALHSEKVKYANVVPNLIKVEGDPFVGKTTLIRSLVVMLGCTYFQYLEIDNIETFIESKKTKSLTGFELEKTLENIIGDFHSKALVLENVPYLVIALTKEYHFEAQDLLNLRNYIRNKTSSLTTIVMFHESNKNSGNFYYDITLHVNKPSKTRIKEILIDKFQQINIPYENVLENDILNKLAGCIPAQIERIAEHAARKSILQNLSHITYKEITQAINDYKPSAPALPPFYN